MPTFTIMGTLVIHDRFYIIVLEVLKAADTGSSHVNAFALL